MSANAIKKALLIPIALMVMMLMPIKSFIADKKAEGSTVGMGLGLGVAILMAIFIFATIQGPMEDQIGGPPASTNVSL